MFTGYELMNYIEIKIQMVTLNLNDAMVSDVLRYKSLLGPFMEDTTLFKVL